VALLKILYSKFSWQCHKKKAREGGQKTSHIAKCVIFNNLLLFRLEATKGAGILASQKKHYTFKIKKVSCLASLPAPLWQVAKPEERKKISLEEIIFFLKFFFVPVEIFFLSLS
jgi:hypothetical protein